MDTLRYMRRRILCARIPVLLLTLLPALGLAAAVMPALWQLVQGPQDLYAMTPSELEGAYAAAEIDTIWDWYADTVVTDAIGGETVTAREYLVPLSDGRTFIGVQVPARMIPAADRVLEQTGLWRSNPAAYLWDGSSLTVRGGVRPMDEETRELYYDYLQQVYGLSGEELDNFLPLVLVQGKVRGMDGGTILLLGLGAIAFFALTGVNLSWALRDARLQQITDYCRNRPYPEEQVQILDAVVHLGKGERVLSAEDGWLINLEGPRSWMLQHEDVAWIYISRVRQVRHGSAYAAATRSLCKARRSDGSSSTSLCRCCPGPFSGTAPNGNRPTAGTRPDSGRSAGRRPRRNREQKNALPHQRQGIFSWQKPYFLA